MRMCHQRIRVDESLPRTMASSHQLETCKPTSCTTSVFNLIPAKGSPSKSRQTPDHCHPPHDEVIVYPHPGTGDVNLQHTVTEHAACCPSPVKDWLLGLTSNRGRRGRSSSIRAFLSQLPARRRGATLPRGTCGGWREARPSATSGR